jgi:hypothetical protein
VWVAGVKAGKRSINAEGYTRRAIPEGTVMALRLASQWDQ